MSKLLEMVFGNTRNKVRVKVSDKLEILALRLEHHVRPIPQNERVEAEVSRISILENVPS